MCSPNPDLFSWCITPQNSVLIHFKKLVIPPYRFVSSPVYANIDPYGLTGAIIAFSISVTSWFLIILFLVSPLLVIHFTSCGNDPITNLFAIANFGGDFLFAMFGCMPLKQQEHGKYPFEIFRDHGESNTTFKSTLLMTY
jgi:hypothetical protein